MSTATWTAGDRNATTVPIVGPRSALGILGAAGRGIGARLTSHARGFVGAVLDLGAGAALVIGASHLPGAWGAVTPWIIGALSMLIASAKLNP